MKIRKNKISAIISAICILIYIFTSNSTIFNDLKSTSQDVVTLNDTLTVHFLDVGQADSIFIELPNKETMLIDAGNNADDKFVVNYIETLNYSKINYVVGTHPHEDHIGGLDTVIDTFEIQNVYMPKIEHDTKTFESVLLAIKNKDLKIKTAKAGVNIIDSGDLKIDIIAPANNDYKELNNYSAVVKITYKNNSFLFMGDAEKISEDEITSDVSADVIKIGHHGSNTSTSEEFLKRVSPTYAVISVGEGNDYNHPDEEIIDLLNKSNINVFKTNISGTIIIKSDGNSISVEESL
jgi:competence protein ComEC